jgi:hypothetical protein
VLTEDLGSGRSLFSVAGGLSSQGGTLSSAGTGLSPKRFGKQTSMNTRRAFPQPMRKISRINAEEIMRNTGISPIPEESPVALIRHFMNI